MKKIAIQTATQRQAATVPPQIQKILESLDSLNVELERTLVEFPKVHKGIQKTITKIKEAEHTFDLFCVKAF